MPTIWTPDSSGRSKAIYRWRIGQLETARDRPKELYKYAVFPYLAWSEVTISPDTWLVWHDLDHNSKDNMPQIHANLSKNVSVPSVHGGALWADDVNYRLFLFGGEFFSGSPTTSNFMSYDIWYDQWDDFGPPSDDIKRVSYGAATTVKERGEG